MTEEKLRTIEAAEGVLRRLGFHVFRVRHHDAIARLMAEWDDWHARTTDDDEPDDAEEAELDD